MTTSGLTDYDDSEMKNRYIGTSDGQIYCARAAAEASGYEYSITVSWGAPVQITDIVIFKGNDSSYVSTASAATELSGVS